MAKRTGEEDEAVRPGLPDDIIRLILALIPTKSAVRMSLLSKQFEDAWCSGPNIYLDEGKPQANLDGVISFTNVLERYLKFRSESKELHPNRFLHKFRLRMAMNPVREDILEKLLTGFAKEGSLTELDLSCLTDPRCSLSFRTLANINSLTSLSLESVQIKEDFVTRNGAIRLPFLKSMSLKTIQILNNTIWHKLISSCPSIEYLSLTSCSLPLKPHIYGLETSYSTTLKYLEIRDCNFCDIFVTECVNLETFILVSESPKVKYLHLYRCDSLKNIYISEKQLQFITIFSDPLSPCVKATVNTPKLRRFTFNSEEMKDKCVDGQPTELYPSRLLRFTFHNYAPLFPFSLLQFESLSNEKYICS